MDFRVLPEMCNGCRAECAEYHGKQAPWCSGQHAALSRLKREFDPRRGYSIDLVTVPRATRLGVRRDPAEEQSGLARLIRRDHLLCVVAIATLLVLQLWFG